MIIAVDDLKEFHTKNITKEFNRDDYTYLARIAKPILWNAQKYGTRCHFNHMTIEDSQLEEVSQGSKKEVNLRYGIVEYDDMIRDLEHWETLLTSSFM